MGDRAVVGIAVDGFSFVKLFGWDKFSLLEDAVKTKIAREARAEAIVHPDARVLLHPSPEDAVAKKIISSDDAVRTRARLEELRKQGWSIETSDFKNVKGNWQATEEDTKFAFHCTRLCSEGQLRPIGAVNARLTLQHLVVVTGDRDHTVTLRTTNNELRWLVPLAGSEKTSPLWREATSVCRLILFAPKGQPPAPQQTAATKQPPAPQQAAATKQPPAPQQAATKQPPAPQQAATKQKAAPQKAAAKQQACSTDCGPPTPQGGNRSSQGANLSSPAGPNQKQSGASDAASAAGDAGRIVGTLTSWALDKSKKLYGLVKTPQGQTFLHSSNVIYGCDSLVVGSTVSLRAEPSPKAGKLQGYDAVHLQNGAVVCVVAACGASYGFLKCGADSGIYAAASDVTGDGRLAVGGEVCCRVVNSTYKPGTKQAKDIVCLSLRGGEATGAGKVEKKDSKADSKPSKQPSKEKEAMQHEGCTPGSAARQFHEDPNKGAMLHTAPPQDSAPPLKPQAEKPAPSSIPDIPVGRPFEDRCIEDGAVYEIVPQQQPSDVVTVVNLSSIIVARRATESAAAQCFIARCTASAWSFTLVDSVVPVGILNSLADNSMVGANTSSETHPTRHFLVESCGCGWFFVRCAANRNMALTLVAPGRVSFAPFDCTPRQRFRFFVVRPPKAHPVRSAPQRVASSRSTPQLIDGATYELAPLNRPGFRVGIKHGSAQDGAGVRVYPWIDSPIQQFVASGNDDGSWTFRFLVWTESCITDTVGALQLWRAGNARADQQFMLVPCGEVPGCFVIRCARNLAKVWQASVGAPADVAPALFDGSSSQQFRFHHIS